MTSIPDSLLVSALLAASEDGLIVWGSGGHVLAWNAAAERIFGTTAKEAVSQPLARFFDVELPLGAPLVAGVDAAGLMRRLVAPGIRKDGRRVALAITLAPILKSNRLVAAMAVHMRAPRCWSPSEVELVQRVASRCWESIERSRVEREREALLEKAEAANRAKDEFLAMLGHELRNPLAPISTALQLMKLQNDAAFGRERTVIERQVDHLTRLVDDLLDVSRIARAKVMLRPERIELSEIVQECRNRRPRPHMNVVRVVFSGLSGHSPGSVDTNVEDRAGLDQRLARRNEPSRGPENGPRRAEPALSIALRRSLAQRRLQAPVGALLGGANA